ncbi:hypothetical protein CVM52_19405 [Pseudooceanicola lipolyticus]|uniref:Uncharacterized protein n=1 Tax=Pseudooceanicola lipolyticus TaxID=2029104 RepID=A0A2M8IWT1_9RHOB|nr:hypothetical protein [Pseudooceanicola lipolyticus]PJE34987.1 hypothetical protein CVM52_19405 [Pseudooceanicola lipolyticus]
MSAPPRDRMESQTTPLGIYDRPQYDAITGIEVVAIALTALWLLGALAFFVLIPSEGPQEFDGLRFVLSVLTVFLPVAMIWVAATAARSNRVMREESARLQAAIDGIRQSYVAQQQRGGRGGSDASVARKLDEIAEAAKKTETALATFHTRRDRSLPVVAPKRTAESEEDQGLLALGTPAEELSPPLPTEDFIRALHFPETAEDEEGFTALRRALRDRRTAQIVQASQDVLTLLSQDGIYMDDLRPDMARPETWRQFAQGARGRSVAALGGVRDRTSLALTAGRMKQDPIFRDAAHHFLRLFDRMFADFEKTATDAEISSLSETRTARAFMLLGRVAGTFD